jgi:hypothetical protein
MVRDIDVSEMPQLIRLDQVSKADLERCVEFMKQITSFDQAGASLRARSTWNKSWLESMGADAVPALKAASEYLAVKSLASTIANEMPENEPEPEIEPEPAAPAVGEPGDSEQLVILLGMHYPRDSAIFFLEMCANDVSMAMDMMGQQGIVPTEMYTPPPAQAAKPKALPKEYVSVDVASAYSPDLAETNMQITVTWLRPDDPALSQTHKTLSVEASTSDTIRDLKWRIKLATHGNIGVDRQRLFVDPGDEPEPEMERTVFLARTVSRTEEQLRVQCAAAGIDSSGGKIILRQRLDKHELAALRQECRAAGLKTAGNLMIVHGRLAAFKAGHAAVDDFEDDRTIGEAGVTAGAKVLVRLLISPHAMKLINLAADWVQSFMPHSMSKISRVTFGLLSEFDHVPDLAPLSRVRLAVPFVGKDVPSRSSEFAHPDVLIGLTTLAYRYSGLRPHTVGRHQSDINRVVAQLKKDFGQQLGSADQRPAHLLFEHWKTLGRLSQEPNASSLSVLPLEQFQPADSSQLVRLTQLIGGLPEVIHYYLQVIKISSSCPHALIFRLWKFIVSGIIISCRR